MLTNDTLQRAELGVQIYCASIKNWRKESHWWLGSISGVSGEWRYNWIHQLPSVRRLLSFAIQLLIPGIDVIIPQPTFIHSSSWKRYSSSPDTNPGNHMRTGWNGLRCDGNRSSHFYVFWTLTHTTTCSRDLSYCSGIPPPPTHSSSYLSRQLEWW